MSASLLSARGAPLPFAQGAPLPFAQGAPRRSARGTPLPFAQGAPLPCARRALLIFIAVGLGLSLLLCATPSAAEELGEEHRITFAVERVFGLYYARQSVARDGGSRLAVSETSYGLGWPGPYPMTSRTVPRLAFDYFLSEHLTLGGGVGVANQVRDDDATDARNVSSVLLAPRVGTALRLGRAAWFWPRGGLGFQLYRGDAAQTALSLEVDAPFVLVPAEHLGVLVGPIAAHTFYARTRGIESESVGLRELVVGLSIGMLGWP